MFADLADANSLRALAVHRNKNSGVKVLLVFGA